MVVNQAVELSFVVPMLNAGSRTGQLHDALDRCLAAESRPVELILVDDGSTDGTWECVVSLCRADARVVGVRLVENVGQTGALGAGFSVARGSVVVMMDDDLEIEPRAYRDLVAQVDAGVDFASGRRRGPRPMIRSISSRLYNARLRRWGMQFHDAGCGFNAMTGDLARRLSREGWAIRMHRFKPRVAQITERIVEVDLPVHRQHVSHYGIVDLAASWADIETRFGPLSRRELERRVVIAPIVLGLGCLSWSVVGRSRTAAVGAVVAGSVAAFARMALDAAQRVDDATADRPAWQISEVVGGA